MKKLLVLFTCLLLFVSCTFHEMEITTQNGVVDKVETNDSYGYKFRVEVKCIVKKGVTHEKYVLLTDKNYRVGDTLCIK